MRTRRILGLLLLLIPLGTLAFMARKPVFPAVVCVLALVGARGRVQVEFKRTYHVGIVTVIAAVFALKWIVLPPLRLGGSSLPFFSIGLLNYSIAYHVAQGILLYQAVLLFFRREDGLPRILPLYAAISMVMAGTIPTPAHGAVRDTVFQSASLALAVVTGLYFSASTSYRSEKAAQSGFRSRWRLVVSCALFVLIVGFGWAMGRGLYTYGDRVDRFFGDFLVKQELANTFGFPTDGRFGAIDKTKAMGGNATALRIFSEDAPGYLRGKAYDTFATTRWNASGESQPLTPVRGEGLPEPPPGAHWFASGRADGKAGGAEGADLMEVYRVVSSGSTLFAPLEAAYVCAPVEQISVDVDGALVGEQLSAGTPYTIALTAQTPSAGDRAGASADSGLARLTALPDDLDPRIKELAETITRNCSNDAERVAAIVQYLTSNYEYDLEKGPANAKEPVSAFLFEVRKGHCEFFAASAAVLLRCAGLPSRYVTGFVADEQNAYGGYWVARNKDAHAWAEAYVDSHGWRLVEATPSSGVPTGQTSFLAQLWDYIKYLPSAALAALREMGLGILLARFLEGVGRALSSPGGLVVEAVVVTLAAVMWRLRKRTAGRGLSSDPTTMAMQRLLRTMDRRLGKAGLVRAGSETLHTFAGRVADAGYAAEGDWYRAYAAFRYGLSPTVTQIEELKSRCVRG